MTRDEITTLLLARCERREDDAYLQGIIPNEMRLVQETLEGRTELPWFLMTEDASATTTINEERVPEPDDFLLMDEEQGLYYLPTGSTEYKQLVKSGYDYLQARFGNASGPPWGFAHQGKVFRLRPVPDAVYSLKFKYYARDVWPAGDETNQWMTLAPAVVLNETGLVIAGEYLHNDALMQKFMLGAEKAWQALWKMHEARQHANRSYLMGEPE